MTLRQEIAFKLFDLTLWVFPPKDRLWLCRAINLYGDMIEADKAEERSYDPHIPANDDSLWAAMAGFRDA